MDARALLDLLCEALGRESGKLWVDPHGSRTKVLFAPPGALGEGTPPPGPIKIKRGPDWKSEENVFTAYINRRVAGKMIVSRSRKSERGVVKPSEVYNVVVNEPYRRMGVGTALYKAAEGAYPDLGPSSVTSDDAFNFWKSYRPGSMDGDLRHRKDELTGRRVRHREYTGIIRTVGSGAVTADITDPPEKVGRTFSLVNRNGELEAALQAGEENGPAL